jgi:hypothetical protein
MVYITEAHHLVVMSFKEDVEIFVKLWHQNHAELAKTLVSVLMHKGTQVFLMLRFSYIKEWCQAVNYQLHSLSC